jgi:hypothetical protein
MLDIDKNALTAVKSLSLHNFDSNGKNISIIFVTIYRSMLLGRVGQYYEQLDLHLSRNDLILTRSGDESGRKRPMLSRIANSIIAQTTRNR